MSEQQLPQFVVDRLNKISTKLKIPIESLRKEYAKVFKLHAKEAELTDEEKHRYAVMILWKDYMARPPAEMKNIIIAGLGGERKTSTNKIQSDAMVLTKANPNAGKYALRRLVFQENALKARSLLTMYAGYTVKLGEFSEGGDLVADDRADFANPISTGLTFAKLMQIVGAVRVPKLSEAAKYPSRVGSTGYTDNSDWKIVRGVVDRTYVGLRKDKITKFGVYNIIDTSLGDKEPELTEDGRVVRPGFTIWAAPELVKWANNSLLDFAGTIGLDDQKKATMNAYVINPVVGEKIPSSDEQ